MGVAAVSISQNGKDLASISILERKGAREMFFYPQVVTAAESDWPVKAMRWQQQPNWLGITIIKPIAEAPHFCNSLIGLLGRENDEASNVAQSCPSLVPIEISLIKTLLLANPAIPIRGRRPQMSGREPLAPVIGLHGNVVFLSPLGQCSDSRIISWAAPCVVP